MIWRYLENTVKNMIEKEVKEGKSPPKKPEKMEMDSYITSVCNEIYWEGLLSEEPCNCQIRNVLVELGAIDKGE